MKHQFPDIVLIKYHSVTMLQFHLQIAGTISAVAGNGIGVRGMGRIPVYITRGLNNNGQARESDVREAVEQCEKSGAKIISLSLSGGVISQALSTILNRIYRNGGLVIAAAGNQSTRREAYPASSANVISVSAVGETGQVWSGSNYGPWIELAAPGQSILSTAINNRGQLVYAQYSGTSMAVPHVAGAAALVWSHNPQCTNVQIRYALAYTARDVGSKGCDQVYGYGIVQAKAALDFIKKHGCAGVAWGNKSSPDGKCSSVDVLPVTPW